MGAKWRKRSGAEK
jgi:hypothetical protein